MKTTVFFSSTVAILFSSILFLAGCGGSSVSSPAPPSPSAGGSSAHGTFVYVRNDNSRTGTDGTISGFRMNPDGTLTALQGSPFSINGNLAILKNFLVVPNYQSMTSYRIDPSSGALTPAHTVAGPGMSALFVDPIVVDSKNLYRGSADCIYGFSMDDDGSFAAIPGSPFLCNAGGVEFYDLAVQDSMLFASWGSLKFDGLLAYTLQDGSITGGQDLGSTVGSLAARSTGRVVYGADGGIASFSIHADGMISRGSGTPPSSGNHIEAVAVDPTGKFLAAIDNTSQSITDSHISVFSIDPLTSSLTQLVAPVSTGVPLGSSITFDDSGKFILITHGGGTLFPNDVMVFSFDPASGTVTKIQSAPTGMFPGSAVIATF